MLHKTTKALITLCLLLNFSILGSCDEDNNPVVDPTKTTIADLAAATPNLSNLTAALQRAELVNNLKADGSFTVFAPTNKAFQALLDSNESWNSLADIPVETLITVLKFHVVNAKIMSTDLSDTYVKTLAQGPNKEALSLQVETTGGVEFNGDAKPVAVDIKASNGIIHIIDKVMLPPNIVTLAVNNSNFSSLVAALTDSRHTTDFASILSGDGPFTVFAPTNEAFQALLDSNEEWNSLADVPIETLEAVLKYHVVNKANVQAKQLTNGDVTMLDGDKITIDLTNGAQIKTSSGQTVNILVGPATNDVQGTNGVIHAVDAVLLPGSKEEESKTIAELAAATPSLSNLSESLQKADLVDALKADGNFTIFAPNNKAFQALLDSNESWNSLADIPVETLISVLSFHVVNAKIMSTDLSDTYVKTLAQGPNQEALSLQVETTDGIEFNGDAKPVTVDIEASNGVIHIIDKVMLPPNVVTLAVNNSNFSTLVAALTDSRHTTDFASILSGDGPFTIFAPTNSAFQALLDSNEAWNSLADVPIETLDAVLKYHVINKANVQAKQLTNGDVTMLSGGKVTVDLTNGAQLKTSSGQTVNILVGAATNDVQGTNGVIHAVDAVLLP